MLRTLSKLARCFGLEVVHVIVLRRSRHGDLRLTQSKFPSNHPTDITLNLDEAEPLIQRRQSDGLLEKGLLEKGSEIDGRSYHCGGMDWNNCDCIFCTSLISLFVTCLANISNWIQWDLVKPDKCSS